VLAWPLDLLQQATLQVPAVSGAGAWATPQGGPSHQLHCRGLLLLLLLVQMFLLSLSKLCAVADWSQLQALVQDCCLWNAWSHHLLLPCHRCCGRSLLTGSHHCQLC
jgi:hypothetical protein